MLTCSDEVLRRIAALEVVDDARTKCYVAALDARMAELLAQAGSNPPPLWWAEGREIRSITCLAGYLAFFHAFRGSCFYRDPRLLAAFREILSELLKQQRDTGELVWGETGFPPHPHASHGQAWYLEPLLLGMNWLRGEFAANERAGIDRALYRTADFILARPIPEVNNRGVIVCSILALCGRYFREARFLTEAMRNFHHKPIEVFDPRSGQILEGSGPDGNYSGTTYEYLYIYRLMSGDTSIDPAMVAALRWFGRVLDPNGYMTYCGAATRVPIVAPGGKIHDLLPALECYSPEEPFFQRMIEQYLPTLGDRLGAEGHSISPTIWALLEHRSVAPPSEAPAWYTDMRSWYWEHPQLGPQHFGYNEGYESLYFPVRQAYTTCVVLRGRSPHKDLQCWTYGTERPTIYPTKTCASRTRAWGIDTAVQGVSHIKIPNFAWVLADADGLIAQWEELWRYYVFTPRTTFIIGDGSVGRLTVDWVVNHEVCGRPEVGAKCLHYPGRRGRLWFGQPPVQQWENGLARVFQFDFSEPPTWFALSDETFVLISAVSGHMLFCDGAGTWEVRYTFVPGAADLTEKLTSFPWTAQKHLQIRRVGAAPGPS